MVGMVWGLRGVECVMVSRAFGLSYMSGILALVEMVETCPVNHKRHPHASYPPIIFMV